LPFEQSGLLVSWFWAAVVLAGAWGFVDCCWFWGEDEGIEGEIVVEKVTSSSSSDGAMPSSSMRFTVFING
jgi:hypothetical protein